MSKEIKNQVVTRNAYVRNTSAELLENRQVEFVISDESVDTYGTVFKRDGWLLDRFNKNGVVFYVHESRNPNPDLLVGSGEVFFEGDKMIGRVTFEPEDINPLAEKVLRKIEHGTLKMASVGAMPYEARMGKKDLGEKEDTLYFTKQELLEFSVCPIGSNPNAHKRNAQTVEEIRNNLVKEIPVTDVEDVTAEQIRTTKNVREAQLIINQNKK